MMINILSARYQGEGLFDLQFSDGKSGIFDLYEYLHLHRGPLLEPLRDERYAARAFVEAGALAWPNGLEISPSRIRECTPIVSLAA